MGIRSCSSAIDKGMLPQPRAHKTCIPTRPASSGDVIIYMVSGKCLSATEELQVLNIENIKIRPEKPVASRIYFSAVPVFVGPKSSERE